MHSHAAASISWACLGRVGRSLYSVDRKDLKRPVAGICEQRLQAAGFPIVGGARQVAEQLHLLKPSAQKAIFEFTARVDGVFKGERSSMPVFNQEPFRGNTAPIIAQLTALHQQRAVFDIETLLGPARLTPTFPY